MATCSTDHHRFCAVTHGDTFTPQDAAGNSNGDVSFEMHCPTATRGKLPFLATVELIDRFYKTDIVTVKECSEADRSLSGAARSNRTFSLGKYAAVSKREQPSFDSCAITPAGQ